MVAAACFFLMSRRSIHRVERLPTALAPPSDTFLILGICQTVEVIIHAWAKVTVFVIYFLFPRCPRQFILVRLLLALLFGQLFHSTLCLLLSNPLLFGLLGLWEGGGQSGVYSGTRGGPTTVRLALIFAESAFNKTYLYRCY